MRMIKQITNIKDTLAALCDDGTVWVLTISWEGENFEDRSWLLLRDVPQESLLTLSKRGRK